MQSSLVDTSGDNEQGTFVEAMYLSHIEPDQIAKFAKQETNQIPKLAKLEDRDPYDYVGPNGYPAYYCVGSVEIVDHDKEIVDIDGIKEVLHIMKEQGALIQGFHSNQPAGKWFDYGFFDRNGKRAMYLGYELYDHYESNRDMIRRHHLPEDDPDKIRGLSIGGKVLEKNRECDNHTCYTRLKKIEGWEFSCVDHPANPGALHIEDPIMLQQIVKSMIKRDKRRKQNMATKPKIIRESPSSSNNSVNKNSECKPCDKTSHPSFVKGEDGMYKCPECGASMKMYEKGKKTNKEDISDDENQDGDAMDAYDSYNESSGSSYQDEENMPEKMNDKEDMKNKEEDYDDEQGEVPGEQDTGPDEYSDSDKMSEEMEGDQMATENNNGEGGDTVTREEFVQLKEIMSQIHSAMGLTKQEKVPTVIEKDGKKYQLLVEEDSEDVNKSQQDNNNDETAQLRAELEKLNKRFNNATLRKSGMPDQLNKQDNNIKGQPSPQQNPGDMIKMADGRMVSEQSFAKSFDTLDSEAKFHVFMDLDAPRRQKTARMGGIAVLG